MKPLSEVLPEFISDLDVQGETKKKYKGTLIQYFKYLATKKIEWYQVKKSDIIEYKQYLAGKLQDHSINMAIGVVKQFYKWANVSGYCSDPSLGIKLIKTSKEFKRYPLTTDQVKELLHSIDTTKSNGKRDHALINLMLKTGARRIEAVRANVGDLMELNDKYGIQLQRKGSINKNEIKIISPELYTELRQLVIDRPEANNNDPLFISYHRGKKNFRLTKDCVSKIIKAYMIKINLNSSLYCAHSLRHTTAVTLLDAGYDLYYVQSFLNHASAATTQIYTKTYFDRLKFDDKGSKTLENLF